MREVRETIPVALQELHEAGFDQVYVDQLGEQVTRHDESYLARRGAVRRVLGLVNIDIPELPHGHSRPGASKMYQSLRQLEEAGVVAGEFEEPVEGVEYPRRKYFLVKPNEDGAAF
jgi:hypothetical protein